VIINYTSNAINFVEPALVTCLRVYATCTLTTFQCYVAVFYGDCDVGSKCDVIMMESMEQQKAEESSVPHVGASDSAQHSLTHSLLSVKTLQPWHIPEHCIVSVFTSFSFSVYLCLTV